MGKIAHEFARRMGLDNHQWIACTHKDTGKPHIHLIANRIGVDGKVFDTTFMSNRSARIAEELSRDMGLTIANKVHRQKPHQEVYSDPDRQRAKERLQRIAYSELKSNTTLAGFLYGLERRDIGIEPAKNKQGKTYGIRFSCEGRTLPDKKRPALSFAPRHRERAPVHSACRKEIGREFGYHSLAGNFYSPPEPGQSPQVQHSHGPAVGKNHNSHVGGIGIIGSLSEGAASLLGDLFSMDVPSAAESDNAPQPKKKKRKQQHYYGRQQ
jgi:hypothetical protein